MTCQSRSWITKLCHLKRSKRNERCRIICKNLHKLIRIMLKAFRYKHNLREMMKRKCPYILIIIFSTLVVYLMRKNIWNNFNWNFMFSFIIKTTNFFPFSIPDPVYFSIFFSFVGRHSTSKWKAGKLKKKVHLQQNRGVCIVEARWLKLI